MFLLQVCVLGCSEVGQLIYIYKLLQNDIAQYTVYTVLVWLARQSIQRKHPAAFRHVCGMV